MCVCVWLCVRVSGCRLSPAPCARAGGGEDKGGGEQRDAPWGPAGGAGGPRAPRREGALPAASPRGRAGLLRGGGGGWRGKEGGTLQPQGRLQQGLPSPRRGNSQRGSFPPRPPRGLPGQGCPGPPCTHRWVPGRCWSIHAPARPGRLPPHALPVPPMQRGAMPHHREQQRWGAPTWPAEAAGNAGARGGWLRSG